MAYSINAKDYFNTKLYTGNASSTNAITNVGFEPSWVWLKARNYGESHRVYDAVRGNSYHISPNSTGAESSSFPLTSFDSDGFTIGSSDDSINGNYNYVSWNWKAGTTSGLSGGTITPSSYSISAASGFGIYKYTGTGSNGTISHGLGSAPRMVIVKKTVGGSDNWTIYYNPAGGTNPQTQIDDQQGRAIFFNTNGFSTHSSYWNGSAATDTVFHLGTTGVVNESGHTYIAYAFADVIGYQKFCGWYANADSNAPFLYTGFKPAYFMMFNINNSGRWQIADAKRNPSNEIDKKLSPHNANTENTTGDIACDFLSNGIKIRGGSTSDINYGSGNMMYGLAIAEAPLVGSNNVPCTAR
nr:hypothetical protein [uncultured Mediterranean phage uvMED]